MDVTDDVKLLTSNHVERTDTAQLDQTQLVDPFEDDTPLSCGVEDTETCEACQ